jgi:leader peptidase (prepilin peptidase) / N-methyltransferase
MDVEPLLASGLVALLGLLIGSFLNVVIYRLPKMMERQWAAEVAAFQAEQAGAAAQPAQTQEPFNLMVPRSRCPSCGHLVAWYENIPVISYVFLRGKCSECRTPISIRYPLVELLTGGLFFVCAHQWGLTTTGMAWCAFSAVLVALAFIDWDTTLLPDDLTLPLLWAGLLASALHWIQVPLVSSVAGAAAGYLSLWMVYWAFKLATGKEGMGYGDFKLFAALGAWFGWEALVPMILMSSVIGAIVGIGLKIFSSLREGGYVPFGPFLAAAGLTAMIAGPKTMLDAILRGLGL